MRVFGLIPAAGQSRRMGRPKLALPLGPHTVLERVVAAVRAGGVAEVVVVLGRQTAFLRMLAEQAGAQTFVLPAETPDMRATVQAGLAWIEEKHFPRPDDAWLLLPADHPTLQSELVRQLIAAAQAHNEASILVPAHRGQRGHPTLLRWRHVAALRAFSPGQGLNAYIRAHTAETIELDWPTAEVLRDLDTPQDYERLQKELGI
jgi:molybdenum cofactor cytidylyltransferase